jgi:hypothetical protein
MFVVSDIVHQIVKHIIVFWNDNQFFQPIAADEKRRETSLVVAGCGNQPAKRFNFFSFGIDRFISSHFKFR